MICRWKISILHFAKLHKVRMTAGPDAIGIYRFDRNITAHAFRKTCGTGPREEITFGLRSRDVPFAHLPAQNSAAP